MEAAKTMPADAMPAVSRATTGGIEPRAAAPDPATGPGCAASTGRPMPGELIGYASIAGIAALTLLRATGLL